jgi:hypothetical protein
MSNYLRNTTVLNKIGLKIINTTIIISYGRIELASLPVSLFPSPILFVVVCIS